MANTKKTKYEAPSIEFLYPNGVGPNVSDTVDDVANTVATDPMTLKQVFDKGWGAIKAHPWQAAGTGILGAVNLGGLFDNNKLLGQGIGAGIGLATPKLIELITKNPLKIGGLGRANLAMIGGGFGALFDALRAKQEEEKALAQQQRYYGG